MNLYEGLLTTEFQSINWPKRPAHWYLKLSLIILIIPIVKVKVLSLLCLDFIKLSLRNNMQRLFDPGNQVISFLWSVLWSSKDLLSFVICKCVEQSANHYLNGPHFSLIVIVICGKYVYVTKETFKFCGTISIIKYMIGNLCEPSIYFLHPWHGQGFLQFDNKSSSLVCFW